MVKSSPKDIFVRLRAFASGGLAMFDVYSDYAVLNSFRQSKDENYFKITLAIVVFAAIAIAVQLYRNNLVKNDQKALTVIVLALSLVQGHWFILFGLIIKNHHQWKKWKIWFETVEMTEVVLESIPQLLFQSYVVIVRANTALQNGTISGSELFNILQAQFISIGFSLVMAGKTILFTTIKYPAQFTTKLFAEDGGEFKLRLHSYMIIIIFSYSSLISRSLLIIISGLAMNTGFFYFFFAMAAVRLVYYVFFDIVKNRKYKITEIITDVQYAVSANFRDYWNQVFFNVISTTEIAAMTYLVFFSNAYPETFNIDAPLKNIIFVKDILRNALILSTAIRVISGLVLQILVRKNWAVKVEKIVEEEEPEKVPEKTSEAA